MNAKARYAAAMEHAPTVAIWTCTRDGLIEAWNDGCAKLFGIDRQQALGRCAYDVLRLPEMDAGAFEHLLRQIWDSGQAAASADWKIGHAPGAPSWVCSHLFPLLKQGKTQQIVCIAIDITQRKDCEQRLSESEQRFRSFFMRSAHAIIQLRGGQFHDFNPAAMALFGFGDDASGMTGLAPHAVSPRHQPDGRRSEDAMAQLHAIALERGNHRFEWQYCTRSGRAFWGETALTAVSVGGETLLYALVQDITARKAAEQQLRLAAQVFESSHDAIMIFDADWRVVSVNAAFTAISGHRAQDMLGQTAGLMRSPLADPAAYGEIRQSVDQFGHWQGEALGQRKNGQSFPVWASCTAVKHPNGRVAHYIVIFADITERKESERHIRHMSEHDFLTGLPNRGLLFDRLQLAIAAARRSQHKLAVLFLDLDRFKHVNDTLGHDIGDRLLQVVADRLRKCVRSNDTVSRQGGDEFVILLTEIGGAEHAAHIAANILQVVNHPCQVDAYALSISTSIGISIYPDDGADIDMLVKNADTAMYHAKETGRSSYRFFNRDMNARMVERVMLENQLRQALPNQEFFLHYQPQVEIASGRTVTVEALIRWHRGEGDTMRPQQFLAVAEECGLTVAIGDWVLDTACRQAQQWHEQGMPVTVAVNLSAAQLRQKDFLQKVTRVLHDTGLSAHCLELEITERLLIDGSQAAAATMHALRAMGVQLAVDDFGTGYSSLSDLKQLPVDKLKIDQSFVQDLDTGRNDAAIISAILIIAKSLKLKVVAEGVETADQLAFLQSHGCDECQGHYVARPLPPADLARFLAQH